MVRPTISFGDRSGSTLLTESQIGWRRLGTTVFAAEVAVFVSDIASHLSSAAGFADR